MAAKYPKLGPIHPFPDWWRQAEPELLKPEVFESTVSKLDDQTIRYEKLADIALHGEPLKKTA